MSKTKYNRGHNFYKVYKMRILKRNLCNFCEHVFFADTSQNLGTFRGYQQKKQAQQFCHLGKMGTLFHRLQNKAFCR